MNMPEMPLEPRDVHVRCYCGYCDGEIYPWDLTRSKDGKTYHSECVLDMIQENPGLEVFADYLGYKEEIA